MLSAQEVLTKIYNGQKINYDKVYQQLQKTWQERPHVLLHACCAPCTTYSLDYLCESCEVTVYYANPNIYPPAEHQRRRLVLEKFIHDFNACTGNDVVFIAADDNFDEFAAMVTDEQLANAPEGGARCAACFDLRLSLAAQKARELKCDYFTSTLTISPLKNSQLINTIGLEIQEKYGVNYLPTDFKKNGGYTRSVAMCEEYGIYRQHYCGCQYAAVQQGVDLVEVKAKATLYTQNNNAL